uniref:Uncharacterized protein n=1 Tax=Triticum urartu TaxID=4572 RepID=A0A8R7TJB1_TRIUA
MTWSPCPTPTTAVDHNLPLRPNSELHRWSRWPLFVCFFSVSSDISQLLLASVTTISERRSSGCHHTKGEEPKMNLSRLTVNDPTTETATSGLGE